MTSLDRKLQASAFVRRNSGKVAAELPHNQLAQLLHKSEMNDSAVEEFNHAQNTSGFDQWFGAYGSESWEVEDLFKEFELLAQTWDEFQMRHPGTHDLGRKGPPSFHDLQSFMRETVQDWDARGNSGLSKAKNSFLGFSDTLLSFSDLFSIIPDGDKYVSLFTGVISTTVKAAGRHTEISEGYASALAEIGNAMCLSTAISRVHQSSESIRRLVVLLYIRYSRFFCHFMQWHLGSRWERIKSSLRNDFYLKEVTPQVTDIRSICNRIKDHAQLLNQRQAQITDDRVLQLHGQNKLDHQQRILQGRMMMERLDKHDAKLKELMELIIGYHCHENAAAMAEQHMYAIDVASARFQDTAQGHVTRTEAIDYPTHGVLGESGIGDRRIASSDSLSKGIEGRGMLEGISRSLLKYLPTTNLGPQTSEDESIGAHLIPSMIVERLRDWAGSPQSEVLWILSMAFSNLNDSHLAALHIHNLAAVAKIPCVSVFCTPDAEFEERAARNQSREANMLIAVLYALIHRLTMTADETVADTPGLSAIMSSLNGQLDTVPKALEAIHLLLRHRNPLLLIILSGLEQVETDETEPYLRELIDMIHADARPDSRLKVLLGSEGYLRSGSGLAPAECLDCSLLPISRPGQALPGGRFVNEIEGFSRLQ